MPPGKLDSLTLKLSVLDAGRIGRFKQLIGHIILPLSELEGVASDEEPQLYKLDIEKVRHYIILSKNTNMALSASNIYLILDRGYLLHVTHSMLGI